MAMGLLLFIFYSVNKAWRTYNVLNHARMIGIEQAADLRAKDTIGSLVDRYGLLLSELSVVLESSSLSKDQSLRDIAYVQSIDELELIERVQNIMPRFANLSEQVNDPPSFYDRFVTDIVSLTERYGVPMLLLVVFLGALRLPVPAGPVAALVGVMAFEGAFDGLVTALAILMVAVAGDLLLFITGRYIAPESLVRYGRFIGYTARNRLRVDHLFHQWGGLTLFITRSLVAHIGAVVSLLAGSSGISYLRYTVHCVIGRAFWLLIYFGFGYFVGGDINMASGFLGYFAMSLVGLLGLFLLIELYIKQHPRH